MRDRVCKFAIISFHVCLEFHIKILYVDPQLFE